MADEESDSSLSGMLTKKYGGVPVWVIVLVLAIGGGYLWYRHKQSSGSNTSAAASQTNSDLGSASQLANAFTTAGVMPYQGGDTYINSVGNGSIGGPPEPQTIAVSKGQDAGALINQIRAKMDPNFSWADFWALNPGIAKMMHQNPKTKVWTFNNSGIVTISKPGFTNVPAPNGSK
jgi:hypothetical protein